MATEELGRRERKRLQTREAIATAAVELFAERGFDETTISDITERADVSRRTFFSHFPAKEDAVFADFPDAIEAFHAHLAERDPGETVFDGLRSWLPLALAAKDEHDDLERCRRSLVQDVPQLEARRRALMGQFVDLIAEEAARDLGVGRDDLRAQLVGSAATTALLTLEAEAHGDEDTAAALAKLDQVITFLTGGLRALRDAG